MIRVIVPAGAPGMVGCEELAFTSWSRPSYKLAISSGDMPRTGKATASATVTPANAP